MVFKKSENPKKYFYNVRLDQPLHDATKRYKDYIYHQKYTHLNNSDVVREAMLFFLESKGMLKGGN